MVKRKRVTRVTSNEDSTQQEVKTPEQPLVMHQTRSHTRIQTPEQAKITHQSSPHTISRTPEQPQIIHQSRPHTRSQTKPELDSHIEQHGAPTEPQQDDASVEQHQSPKHLSHRAPRSATISYEEFCDGVHSYVEAQHGAQTGPQQETPENLQVVPMDLEHTPEDVKSNKGSSKVTILGPPGESKSTQAFTRLSHIWNLPEGYRVAVEFDSDFQPIKHEGGLLRRFLGAAMRKPTLIPIHFKTWRKVPSTYKDGLWDIIKSKFEIPIAHEKEIKKILLQKVGYMWRGHKCSIKARYFDENKSMEEAIASVPPRVDKEQWASLVTLWHTKDMKSLSRANKAICKKQKKRQTNEELKEKDDVAPTLAELFISTHKRKDGTARNEKSAKKIFQAGMEKLLARHPENSVSSDDDEANGRTVNYADINSPGKGKEIVEDKRKARKSKKRGKAMIDSTNGVQGFSTPRKKAEERKQAEEDRRQAREDRKEAEEDRRQAREDRKQAEENRRQAREDRKHAEEERAKVEEERKKYDEEIRFLKERLAWMESLVGRILPVPPDVSTVPSEVPRLKNDPSNRPRMYSATSSHAQEHCSPNQDL